MRVQDAVDRSGTKHYQGPNPADTTWGTAELLADYSMSLSSWCRARLRV